MTSLRATSANPTTRHHPWWSVLAHLPLVVAGVLVGIMVSAFTDVIRVSVIDPRFAYRVGYAGEIGGRDIHEPQGISFDQGMVLWFVGLVLLLAGLAVTGGVRRQLGDPHAPLFTAGVAFLSALPGFVWLSLDWVELPAGDLGAVRRFIELANLWMPVLIAATGVLLLQAWRHRAVPPSDDD